MVKSCCVWDCTARFNPSTSLSFYRFPNEKTEKNRKQRAAWISKLGRLNWEPNKWAVVCAKHFVSDKPSSDPDHPDYCPSLYLKPVHSICSDKKLFKRTHQVDRYNRVIQRKQFKCAINATAGNSVVEEDPPLPEGNVLNEDFERLRIDNERKDEQISQMNFEIQCLRNERDELKEKERQKFSVKNLTTKKLKYYTGISSTELYTWVVSECYNFIPVRHCISIEDQVLLALMKVRLGLQNNDLAYRFEVSSTTVSEILNQCIPVMSQRLKHLIQWPSRVLINKNMPKCFKKRFNRCRVIIDCTEFFVERPYNLKTRAKTWSNYKHHHTLKALIGITPYGSISFTSGMFGGRISDKEITSRSGFYDKLEYGDQVMADRGFTISHELAVRGAHLVMPPFVSGRKQFPGYVISRARQISSLRIHVERAIGRIKQYAILKHTMHASLVPLASSILSLCCALTNLRPKLVQ